MSKYQVIGNIKRGGKLLARNQAAEFDDAAAERLVRDGYLQPIAAAKNSEGEPAGNGHKDPGLESQAGASLAGVLLLGSDRHPAHIDVAPGKTVQLGDAVRAAFTASELTESAWNALPIESREERIDAAIEQLRAQHAAPKATAAAAKPKAPAKKAAKKAAKQVAKGKAE